MRSYFVIYTQCLNTTSENIKKDSTMNGTAIGIDMDMKLRHERLQNESKAMNISGIRPVTFSHFGRETMRMIPA